MDIKQIRQCLEELNDELQAINIKGEVCLYGGAVMCLVYDARPATKDVDAVFKADDGDQAGGQTSGGEKRLAHRIGSTMRSKGS